MISSFSKIFIYVFYINIMKISISKILTKHHFNIKSSGLYNQIAHPDFEPIYDSFKLSVEKALNFDSYGNLTFVNYYPSVILTGVIMDILRDKMLLKELAKTKINPKLELLKLEQEILKNKNIGDKKIKSLIGYGKSALVFETDNGEIIKITRGDHFNGREPADFDLPIIKSGKITDDGKFYYYIEDKVSQDKLTQAELHKFVKHIKNSGFYLRDYREEGLPFGNINCTQFGKDANGKIYLIDPECAEKINPDESLIDKIQRFIFK